MPSEVYKHTLEGLSQMVSARAASQVLDASLRARGYAATEVSPKQMRNLLLGPVLREFSVILPKRGLKQNLRELADSLKGLEPKKAKGSFKIEDTVVDPIEPELSEISEQATEATQADVQFSKSAGSEMQGAEDIIDDLVGVPTLFEAPRASANVKVTGKLKGGPTLFETAAPAVDKVASASDTKAVTLPALSKAQLDEFSLNFAKLDHVKLVAALGSQGDIISSRGGGIDLESLSRLGLLGLKLLAKSGKLRSYYLAYSGGQLFLFDLGAATLVVVGTPELNLGAVFSTMSTLKEAL